ncbi:MULTISPECIES: hypothetical protein [unclassified Paenibacillus]|nr:MULTISPECIES: hypothetical protein [unclassified Paenibacillus]OAX48467.1 hypothetical protein gpAD87_09865 [Paenibacillus sp. AD87]SLJ88092.1 hypothetical protein SAMN06272722_10172 [Paenibacillus sp. RU5A]SOC65242.1 hypothetical protein SAMN05880581_1011119 [Paenibacillus sp. RU26A]SOC68621.1 hypothetical protein SAMN05880586_1011118 [Paenibacillus sp. RU5M]
MKKKLSLVMLILSLVITLVPLSAFASDEIPPVPIPLYSPSSHGSGGW